MHLMTCLVCEMDVMDDTCMQQPAPIIVMNSVIWWTFAIIQIDLERFHNVQAMGRHYAGNSCCCNGLLA